MGDLVDRIRTRVLPALLTAFGVAGLAVGMLSLTSAATADPLPSASPTSVAAAWSAPTAPPLITFPPLPSAALPSTSPTPPVDRFATRVRVAALKIDLPVINPSGDAEVYPLCNVAMFIRELGQPGEGHATYIYAHAREGMFLPLLDASLVQNGKSMLGMVIEVWTNDDRRFLYEITEVRRHVPFDTVIVDAPEEQLWLQTSEGRGHDPKLQVVAKPLSNGPADPADAHPEPKPIVCG